ncbi:MAG: hypothetical protein M3400_13655 [Actinomycetota bacterium]|nr:hypothetical protein [Actinomycetota bacterium]
MDDADAGPKDQPVEPESATRRTADKSSRELDVGWGESPREFDQRSEDDERLLRERPPHWER